MDIKLNISPQSIKKGIVAFLHRFHVIIFTIVVLGGLAIVVLLLNNIVVRSGQKDGYTSDISTGTFDQVTIKKIQELQNRSQSSVPSSGRINPFVE